MTVFTAALSDNIDITGRISFIKNKNTTIGATPVSPTKFYMYFIDTVGIVGHLKQFPSATDIFVVGITDTVTLTGNYVQFDTWRPIMKPDNSLVLLCRTPTGNHDTYTGLQNLSLWTINIKGTSGSERRVIQTPAANGFGWVSYGHPEWHPNGHQIVVWVETSTSYKLMLIDSDGFGQ